MHVPLDRVGVEFWVFRLVPPRAGLDWEELHVEGACPSSPDPFLPHSLLGAEGDPSPERRSPEGNMSPGPADMGDSDGEEDVVLAAREEDEGEYLDGEPVDEVCLGARIGMVACFAKLLGSSYVFDPARRRGRIGEFRRRGGLGAENGRV